MKWTLRIAALVVLLCVTVAMTVYVMKKLEPAEPDGS